jgi:hypothetical protein
VTPVRALERNTLRASFSAAAAPCSGTCSPTNPYTPTCSHSYFRDLVLVEESERRKDKAIESPILRGRDGGALDYSDHDLDEAQSRLRIVAATKRDLSVSSVAEAMKPTLPNAPRT